MTDHIGEATQKVIDLDALEKLADEGLKLATGSYTEKGVYRHSTIKALIAELKEAHKVITYYANTDLYTVIDRDTDLGHDDGYTARAFLVRNGEEK